MESVERWKKVLSGSVGGVCNILTGHPLDTVKVRLQVNSKYKSTFDCINKIIRNEGFLGFYKGVATPVVGVAPIFSIFFFGYHLGQDLFKTSSGETLLYREHCMAGMLAGLMGSGITAPGERIKCLLQVQDKKQALYKGPVHCLLLLYRQHGVSGVFKGTMTTFARDVPASGVYFTSYEFAKANLTTRSGDLSTAATLVAGGIAGVCNWVVALPADVIKSKLQTESTETPRGGAWTLVGRVLQEEGPRGFYRGALPVFARAFPANAACFLGYESTLKFLNYLSA